MSPHGLKVFIFTLMVLFVQKSLAYKYEVKIDQYSRAMLKQNGYWREMCVDPDNVEQTGKVFCRQLNKRSNGAKLVYTGSYYMSTLKFTCPTGEESDFGACSSEIFYNCRLGFHPTCV